MRNAPLFNFQSSRGYYQVESVQCIWHTVVTFGPKLDELQLFYYTANSLVLNVANSKLRLLEKVINCLIREFGNQESKLLDSSTVGTKSLK